MKVKLCEIRTENKEKYQQPKITAMEVCSASGNVCGWYTQCGEQVKQRS